MTLASLEYAKPLQVPTELDDLVALLAAENVQRYLEIGVRYGGTLERVMGALPAFAVGVAVDFPGGPFGDDNSASILLAAIARLRRFGDFLLPIFGPSSAPEVVARVARFAPYDAVLIDGDHAYEAVKRDFQIYAPMARIVILHDIVHPADIRSRDGHAVDVPRFWQEIKGNYRHKEIIGPNSTMGIGVIYRC